MKILQKMTTKVWKILRKKFMMELILVKLEAYTVPNVTLLLADLTTVIFGICSKT